MVTHQTAVVADDTAVGLGVDIGPYCVVGIDPATEPGAVRVGDGATLRSHAVIYRGVVAGHGLHVGHGVLIREHTVVGDTASIGSHSVIEHHVSIGNGVRIHSNCFVPEHSVLEDGSWLGPGVIVTNARYPNRADTKLHLEGVLVQEGATIGAGVVLLPGVTVGPGAMVGAGSVVVADVPPGSTVVGNPGRVVS